MTNFIDHGVMTSLVDLFAPELLESEEVEGKDVVEALVNYTEVDFYDWIRENLDAFLEDVYRDGLKPTVDKWHTVIEPDTA